MPRNLSCCPSKPVCVTLGLETCVSLGQPRNLYAYDLSDALHPRSLHHPRRRGPFEGLVTCCLSLSLHARHTACSMCGRQARGCLTAVASSSKRWRSNPPAKCSQERLTQSTVTSTMHEIPTIHLLRAGWCGVPRNLSCWASNLCAGRRWLVVTR